MQSPQVTRGLYLNSGLSAGIEDVVVLGPDTFDTGIGGSESDGKSRSMPVTT